MLLLKQPSLRKNNEIPKIQALLRFGASWTAKNNNGLDANNISKRHNYDIIAKLKTIKALDVHDRASVIKSYHSNNMTQVMQKIFSGVNNGNLSPTQFEEDVKKARNINDRNIGDKGDTALMMLLRKKTLNPEHDIPKINILLKHGASLTAMNNKGENAQLLAEKNHTSEIQQILGLKVDSVDSNSMNSNKGSNMINDFTPLRSAVIQTFPRRNFKVVTGTSSNLQNSEKLDESNKTEAVSEGTESAKSAVITQHIYADVHCQRSKVLDREYMGTEIYKTDTKRNEIQNFNSNSVVCESTGAENPPKATLPNGVNSPRSNNPVCNNIGKENCEKSSSNIDIHSFSYNGANKKSIRMENRTKCTKQSNANLLTSTNSPKETDILATENTITVVNKNPLNDELLNGFIVSFIGEFKRKLKKYRAFCLNLASPENDKIDEFFNDISLISLAEVSGVDPGVYRIVSPPIKGGMKRGNILYSRRKASKVIKAFSVEKNRREEELDCRRCIYIILIVALDICRMYQQQIHCIYLSRCKKNLLIFVKDCIDRIIRGIYYRQGTVAKFSKCWERKVSNVPTEETGAIVVGKIRKYKDIENEKEMQEVASFIIQGLSGRAKRKFKRRWVSGRQLQILPNFSEGNESNFIKVSCNSLLHRTCIKVENEFKVPSKGSYCKDICGKCPVRCINHHQDDIIKDCGYRLQSIIDPNLMLKDLKSLHAEEDIKKLQNPTTNAILCNITTFKELMTLANTYYDTFQDYKI